MARVEHVCAIVLAAGASTRFGGQKLLAKVSPDTPNGSSQSILALTLDKFQSVFNTLHVVVPPNDTQIEALVLKKGALAIHSQNADQGMSQSLMAGVRAVSPETGWLIGLGDMPFLSVNTLQELAAELTTDNIVVPETRHGVGNPVAFGKTFADELLQLNGDRGAKCLVQRHPEKLKRVKTDDTGVHADIDTYDDLIRWQKMLSVPDH